MGCLGSGYSALRYRYPVGVYLTQPYRFHPTCVKLPVLKPNPWPIKSGRRVPESEVLGRWADSLLHIMHPCLRNEADLEGIGPALALKNLPFRYQILSE